MNSFLYHITSALYYANWSLRSLEQDFFYLADGGHLKKGSLSNREQDVA